VDCPTDADRAPVPELVALAFQGLRRMQLPSGLFCEELVRGSSEPRGRSVRYTVMAYLGLQKAHAAGYRHGLDLERIRAALAEHLDAPELRPGDLGLYLWADLRGAHGYADELVVRLRSALADAGGLAARIGMELGLIVEGLAHATAGGCATAEPLLREALALLLGRNRAPTGLFYHFGAPGARRRFPNFATQIYSVLALATTAKLGLDARALAAARGTADALVALQLADGGWPWLYDAERGRVVERYEVYSVHQHAMAPMGLLQVAEAAGEDGYAQAALDGLRWIRGNNELGLDMVDQREGLIYRSIRRRRPWDRLVLHANTGAARVLGRPLAGAGRRVELNATCRPYELGWLLEAWCGREQMLERAQARG
jgi:hypothetical protein